MAVFTAEFETVLRGRKVIAHMTADLEDDGRVQLIVGFTDPTTGGKVIFERLTRQEMSALARQASRIKNN